MIRSVFKGLVSLFVDDEFLALAVLVTVAVVTLLVLSGLGSSTLCGVLLVVALPAELIVGVLRTVRRATHPSNSADGHASDRRR
jgi:hypothetical protein